MRRAVADDKRTLAEAPLDLLLSASGAAAPPDIPPVYTIGVPFTTFDILSDEEIRQGLKEYSEWPTYPQVYVNKELIGGCDIVLELKEKGELKQALQPAEVMAV